MKLNKRKVQKMNDSHQLIRKVQKMNDSHQLIRMGRKLELRRVDFKNDTARYEVPDWAFLEKYMWDRVKFIEEFDTNRDMHEVDHFESVKLARMNLVGGDRLAYNATHRKNKDNYVRSFCHLGYKDTVEWTWTDAYIKRPVLLLAAKVMNIMKGPRR